ncbi:unnamed protein product [Musa acuminata subsp. burmannicoides]
MTRSRELIFPARPQIEADSDDRTNPEAIWRDQDGDFERELKRRCAEGRIRRRTTVKTKAISQSKANCKERKRIGVKKKLPLFWVIEGAASPPPDRPLPLAYYEDKKKERERKRGGRR